MIYGELDREGYVLNWMTQGPQVLPFHSEARDDNQLRYEAMLRSRIAEHSVPARFEEPVAGETGYLGHPWKVHRGEFVNLSDFYSVMQRVRFDCATVLEVPGTVTVHARLWSYAAVDVYLNGELTGGIPEPVYKPIASSDLELKLRPGRNLLYLSCETLGVRDTRSVAGLQILDGNGQVRSVFPDRKAEAFEETAFAFLDTVRPQKDRLVFSVPAPEGTAMTLRHSDPDLAKCRIPAVWEDISGKMSVFLPEGERQVTLRVRQGALSQERVIERTEQILPHYLDPVPSFEENLQVIYRRIADVETLSRGEKFGFPVSNMLARKYLGDSSKDDKRLMQEMLELIEMRVDCSDFLMCGLIRYMKNYGDSLQEDVLRRVRSAMTGYRYWMNMEGFDGMCFWSENHSLMFYASAMHAGAMYPDDFFTRAHMTGRELSAYGRNKVLEWLDDVETYGFEEFLSTVYMCVTFAALLNVVDYSDPEISQRAWKITDRLLEMLSKHVFKNGLIAPQGRVYRGVLYPFAQGAMALMNLIDPSLPYDYGEGWLGFLATSRYRLPEGLLSLMREPVSERYRTGNAEIVLEKKQDYCLTSVAVPREGGRVWENITRDPDADTSSHLFTKSYNECFHGTTYFQPGIYGYQQHLWHAALDGAAAIFVNHPGAMSEGGDLRPGYWHGNGLMPALKQDGNVLGAIYRITEHPVHFVHLYAPLCRFDRWEMRDHWLFLQKDKGCIGFWASSPLEAYHGMNWDCEFRMYGTDVACLVVMGGREYPDFGTFMAMCLETGVSYGDTLRYGSFSLEYTPGKDSTQYL